MNVMPSAVHPWRSRRANVREGAASGDVLLMLEPLAGAIRDALEPDVTAD